VGVAAGAGSSAGGLRAEQNCSAAGCGTADMRLCWWFEAGAVERREGSRLHLVAPTGSAAGCLPRRHQTLAPGRGPRTRLPRAPGPQLRPSRRCCRCGGRCRGHLRHHPRQPRRRRPSG
jgi:hypothetical protein